MMKISPYNRLAQILILDPAHMRTFAYETDINVPLVAFDAVNTRPIRIDNTIGTIPAPNLILRPFEIESESRFDQLGIEAIMMSQSVFGKVVRSFPDIVGEHYRWGLPITPNAILMSSDEIVRNKQTACKFARKNNVKLQFWDEIPVGTAYSLPDPEYLGVISECPMDANNSLYAIGILNTRFVMKIDLQ
jgi:hypothetical protein